MILLGPEIVLNGGFETNPSNPSPWFKIGYPQSSFYVGADYPYAGDNHAWFEIFSSAGQIFEIRNELPTMIESGEDYRLSAAISTDTGSSIFACVADSSYLYDNHLGIWDWFYPETTTIPSWHLYSWDFECRASKYPNIWFATAEANPERTILFDAVSLRQRIDLSVGYDYENGQTLDRILTRSAVGNLRVYANLGSSHRRLKAPISWVSSKDASVINSWWQTGMDIRFIENDDYPDSFYDVRIIGDSQPLNQYQPGYLDKFLGVLEMETI